MNVMDVGLVKLGVGTTGLTSRRRMRMDVLDGGPVVGIYACEHFKVIYFLTFFHVFSSAFHNARIASSQKHLPPHHTYNL